MNAWLAERPQDQVIAVIEHIGNRAPQRIADAKGDAMFAVWLLLVDRQIVRRLAGLTYRDLPDWTWRDAYDNDASPAHAVADAMDHWRTSGDLPH